MESPLDDKRNETMSVEFTSTCCWIGHESVFFSRAIFSSQRLGFEMANDEMRLWICRRDYRCEVFIKIVSFRWNYCGKFPLAFHHILVSLFTSQRRFHRSHFHPFGATLLLRRQKIPHMFSFRFICDVIIFNQSRKRLPAKQPWRRCLDRERRRRDEKFHQQHCFKLMQISPVSTC